MSHQDTYECDALIIGSGGSGMSAAVTAAAHGLKVLVVEKEPKFGGTTARSGGWLWIPGTSLAKSWGIHEDPDLARTYLRHEAGNSCDSESVDAFLAIGPKAVDFFIAKTAVRFDMPLIFPTTTPKHRGAPKVDAPWLRARSTGANWATASTTSQRRSPNSPCSA
jgi:aspartate oxidase